MFIPKNNEDDKKKGRERGRKRKREREKIVLVETGGEQREKSLLTWEWEGDVNKKDTHRTPREFNLE